jgi:3-methyladenine DNA glycosylase Mpg
METKEPMRIETERAALVPTVFYNNPNLQILVDANGTVDFDHPQFAVTKRLAEEVSTRLLGCTLVIRGRAFVLTSLELYYGGIADTAHDWYRGQFPPGNGKIKTRELAEAQNLAGLAVYLWKFESPKHCRFDLVFGPAGVPVSVLVRNVYSVDEKRMIGPSMGAPAKILGELGLRIEDHGRLFSDSGDLVFRDTHGAYIANLGTDISFQKRVVNVKATGLGLPPFDQFLWNFSLVNTDRLPNYEPTGSPLPSSIDASSNR